MVPAAGDWPYWVGKPAAAVVLPVLNRHMRMFQQWINVVLGLWIIAVPFTGISGNALAWTLAVTGIVVAALALWGALYEQSTSHRQELIHRTS